MAFGFRRGIRLGKFARINLGKRGASLSLGVRGAHVNFGAKGVRTTVGLPGTGMSYSTTAHSASRTHMTTASNSSGPGCLIGLGYLYLIVVSIAAIAAAAKDGFSAGSVFAAIVVWGLFAGVPLAIASRIRKRAAAKAREAEEQRQAALRAAEEQQQAALRAAAEERWNYLCSKYGQENAQRIAESKIWVGATVEMMIEILGQPVAQDEKVMKTKVSKTYKYNPMGANRYGLRVYVEDGEVVGWENKEE